MKTFNFNFSVDCFDYVSSISSRYDIDLEKYLLSRETYMQDSAYPFYVISLKNDKRVREILMNVIYYVSSELMFENDFVKQKFCKEFIDNIMFTLLG